MMHTSLHPPSEAFKSNLLNKEFHERLLSDLPAVAATAGVPDRAVWTRLSDYCKSAEFEWVKRLRSTDNVGLVFFGKGFTPSVEDKMMAITGACLRNYTDARVMTVQDVAKRIKHDNMPAPTVLLIPNFCVDADSGGHMPLWDINALHGLLITRMMSRLKTVLYCSSPAALEKQYGDNFRKHFEDHFVAVKP